MTRGGELTVVGPDDEKRKELVELLEDAGYTVQVENRGRVLHVLGPNGEVFNKASARVILLAQMA